ncbi:MAG: methylamine utilization protein, partial [Planctomycetaceae bacterium]
PVVHNAAAFLKRSTPFNEVIPAGTPSERIIRKAETLPVRVDCSIHSWMRAWLVVLDHPYAAVSDTDGQLELPLLPAGEWRFRFWHERPQNIPGWIRSNTPETLDRGGLLLTIPATGTLDLGELQLTTQQLSAKQK